MYLKYTMLYTNLNLNVSQFKFTYEFFSVKGRDMVERSGRRGTKVHVLEEQEIISV